MTAWSLARRGLRTLAGWWWRSARPSSGAVLQGRGDAVPEHVAGRPPTPEERWRPSIEPTGPWAEVDPYAAGRWPRRATMAVVAAWGAMVALRVRRDLRALAGGGRTSTD